MAGRGEWSRSTGCPVSPFSLVVCQHATSPELFLAVEEARNRGWWLPGGHVDAGDDHFSAAVRETREEAGIDVELLGVLRVENSMTRFGGRQRVIFLARPTSATQQPKSVADAESVSAAWLTIEQLEAKQRQPPPQGLRGPELLEWARFIRAGGTAFPLAVLTREAAEVPRAPHTMLASTWHVGNNDGGGGGDKKQTKRGGDDDDDDDDDDGPTTSRCLPV